MSDSVVDSPTLDLAATAARLRAVMQSLDLEGTVFAKRLGVPYGTMRSYLGGARAPSPEFLAACFQVFGFMPSWLLTGEGPMHKTGLPVAGLDQAQDDYEVVPVYSARAGAGSGSLSEPEAEYKVAGMSVPKAWLQQRGLKAQSLVVIFVRGSSMEPVLFDGDKVLVDRSDTTPRSGMVYVLRQGDELLVKYCQQLPGGVLRVSSANAAFPSYDVDLERAADVTVLGRVVASQHDW